MGDNHIRIFLTEKKKKFFFKLFEPGVGVKNISGGGGGGGGERLRLSATVLVA